MNIFSYFKNKGIDVVNRAFYAKINEWNSWYISNVRGFTKYRIYTGQDTYVTKKRHTLAAAKMVSQDIADLLMNERVKITLENDLENEYVQNVLKKTRFYSLINEYQERKAAVGTVAYVPYLDDMVVDDEGNVIDGKISIDFYTAQNIYPVSWKNGVVTECVFGCAKTDSGKKYIQLQFHKLENGKYVIENSVVKADNSNTGTELTPAEWKQIKTFATLAERIETDSTEPQFVIDKLNIVNNADNDETNPMGIALFANSIDVLRKMDLEYDSYANEFDMGRKRIMVAPEMVKSRNGCLAFDENDTVFYKLPEEYYGDNSSQDLIKEIDMSLRVNEHSTAINDDLNYLSMKCGFGTGRYRFENGGITTATEVISVNSDMYRTLQKHELILDEVIKNLVKIILRLANVLGNSFDVDTIVKIDFDDSIIEDKQTERNTDKADVAIGAMQLWEYRSKWYAETEAQAKKAIVVESDVIE